MKYSYEAALPDKFSLEQFKQVMDRRGWGWVRRQTAGDVQFLEEVWELPDQRGVVKYIYDHILEVPKIRAETDIHGEPTRILGELAHDLSLLDLPPLRKQAMGTSHDERVYALRALAAVVPNFWGGAVNAFRAALKDPDPGIRRLALFCITRYPYAEFIADLETMAAAESDVNLKASALKLAKALTEHGRNSTA
jgi:hypothetical protein